MNRLFAALITILSLTLFACSGDEGDTITNNYIEGAQCVPGQSVPCSCGHDMLGYQKCNSFGTFDGCQDCTPKTTDAGTDAETSIGEDADTQPDAEVDAEIDAESAEISVQLAATNPPGKLMCAGEEQTQFAFNIINNSNETQVLESLRLHQFGTATYNLFSVGGISGNYIQLAIPDENGYVDFSSINLAIPAKSSQYFVYWAKVDASSPSAQMFGFELENSDAVVIQGNAEVQGDFPIRGNYFTTSNVPCEPDAGTDADMPDADAGTDADTPETSVDTGTDSQSDAGYDKLVVYGDNHPSSEIVIGDLNVWRVFSSYKACANFENVRIKIISPEIFGTLGQSEKSVVTDVGIAVGGALQGTGDFVGSGPGLVDVYLGNDGFVVPAGDCVAFQIWAKLAAVQSTAACSTDECPRSGKAVKIRVGHDSSDWYWADAGTNDEWNSKLYIHAFGETSGEQVYAAKGASEPNFMVVRKSKPVVTPQSLVNSVLSVGQRELARWQVGANGIGAIDQKQFPLHTQWDSGVTLENFRLYRNSLAVAIDQYTITDMASGVDLTVNPAPDALGTYPIVSFKSSDAVYGNGNVYSLYATINTIGTGHNVSTSFVNPGAGNITGNLVNNVGLMPPEVASPNIWHVQEPGAGGYGVGLFLWSDISEVPHSTSSADWATGYLVEVLDHTWTLSN